METSQRLTCAAPVPSISSCNCYQQLPAGLSVPTVSIYATNPVGYSLLELNGAVATGAVINDCPTNPALTFNLPLDTTDFTECSN